MKALCDRCKREYEAEPDVVEKYEKFRELLCPDCQADADLEDNF